MSKLSPEIVRERVSLMRESDREKMLADDEGVLRRILIAKGIISSEERSLNEENYNPNRIQVKVNNIELDEQKAMMRELMDNMKKLQDQLHEIKANGVIS